jgi:hypothetical protein
MPVSLYRRTGFVYHWYTMKRINTYIGLAILAAICTLAWPAWSPLYRASDGAFVFPTGLVVILGIIVGVGIWVWSQDNRTRPF